MSLLSLGALYHAETWPDVVEVHEGIAPKWLGDGGDLEGIRLRRQSGPSS